MHINCCVFIPTLSDFTNYNVISIVIKKKQPKTTEYKLSFIIWQIQFCKGQITAKTGSRYITSKHFTNNIYGTIKCWQVNNSYYLWKPHKQFVFSVKCSGMFAFYQQISTFCCVSSGLQQEVIVCFADIVGIYRNDYLVESSVFTCFISHGN